MIKALKRAHPFVVFTYFTGMFLLAPFSRHPWMTGVQMICLCLLYFYHNRSLKKFFPLIALILIVAVTNPLFVQRGGTILYADTHIRITKEALLYGIHYGCVLVNLLLIFSIFNQYIKKEQWIYLSGRFFPKLGVVTSMAFGLIPRYQNHAKKILNTRKSLKSEQAVQRVMNTVSMETTWAFESSMDQLDSMSARGYGIGKRTHFHLFRWERNDWIHIVEIVILTILNLWAYIHYYSRFFFYPMIIMPAFQMRDLLWMLMMVFQFLLPCMWKENFDVRN